MSSKDTHGLGTRAIHAGQSPDPSTGAVMTPIYATSTYVQSSPGVHQGFDGDYRQDSHELRLATNGKGPLTAQAGVYWFRERSDTLYTFRDLEPLRALYEHGAPPAQQWQKEQTLPIISAL